MFWVLPLLLTAFLFPVLNRGVQKLNVQKKMLSKEMMSPNAKVCLAGGSRGHGFALSGLQLMSVDERGDLNHDCVIMGTVVWEMFASAAVYVRKTDILSLWMNPVLLSP